ncbi:MAG: hypothetical protein UX30_C0004G0012 [Candidatus Saccharibacteria bacterium GW2011_GWA2_46_10]|nr:MAG: hypothetical protein UX30_C0004G0012 [Candidatus Saccharibacteria bacterium GW2011_GWA2_46_10]
MIRNHPMPGTTLVELLMFMGFFALVSGVLIGVLVMSNEQRVRQESMTAVEQEGVQILQILSRRVRSAEKILFPPAGQTGSVLVIQTAVPSYDPTVIAVQTGALKIAEANEISTLSSSGISVSDLMFTNTSVKADIQSAEIKFKISQSVPLPTGGTYSRKFGTLINLFSDSELIGNQCGCAPPVCSGGFLGWGYCEEGVCRDSDGVFSCN